MSLYIVYVINDEPFEISADNFTITDCGDLYIWDYKTVDHDLPENIQKISRAYFPCDKWEFVTSSNKN